MMPAMLDGSPSEQSAVAHVIQLAIAPVFLLSSLGTILGVLSTRLGRIVDRTRVLLDRRESADDEKRSRVEAELKLLVLRRRLVNSAITAGTVAALLVCLLIAVAFLGSLIDVRTGAVLAGLFVLAMVAFVAALVFFLREVLVASRTSSIEH
jgi:hypothetical protein